MIKATITYNDGTEAKYKAKSYIELAAHMEKEREKGAIGFTAQSENGSKIESRNYHGVPIYAEVKGDAALA